METKGGEPCRPCPLHPSRPYPWAAFSGTLVTPLICNGVVLRRIHWYERATETERLGTRSFASESNARLTSPCSECSFLCDLLTHAHTTVQWGKDYYAVHDFIPSVPKSHRESASPRFQCLQSQPCSESSTDPSYARSENWGHVQAVGALLQSMLRGTFAHVFACAYVRACVRVCVRSCSQCSAMRAFSAPLPCRNQVCTQQELIWAFAYSHQTSNAPVLLSGCFSPNLSHQRPLSQFGLSMCPSNLCSKPSNCPYTPRWREAVSTVSLLSSLKSPKTEQRKRMKYDQVRCFRMTAYIFIPVSQPQLPNPKKLRDRRGRVRAGQQRFRVLSTLSSLHARRRIDSNTDVWSLQDASSGHSRHHVGGTRLRAVRHGIRAQHALSRLASRIIPGVSNFPQEGKPRSCVCGWRLFPSRCLGHADAGAMPVHVHVPAMWNAWWMQSECFCVVAFLVKHPRTLAAKLLAQADIHTHRHMCSRTH
jgi:hypothetical protein